MHAPLWLQRLRSRLRRTSGPAPIVTRFGDYVGVWNPGDTVVLVIPRSEDGSTEEWAEPVPAGAPFERATVDAVVRGLLMRHAPGDTPEAWARHATALNEAATFFPAGTHEDGVWDPPATVVAGLPVSVYLDREKKRFVVSVYFDGGVPHWMENPDGTIPLAVLFNGTEQRTYNADDGVETTNA